VNRRLLSSLLCLVSGSILIAVGWWDHWDPNQINRWLAGERIYLFYWHRLALTLAVILPVALLAWWLGQRQAKETSTAGHQRRRSAWGFAVAFAIPFILLLKYQVTWLGINYGSSIWAYSYISVVSIVIAWLMWPFIRNHRLLEWLEQQGPLIILTAMIIFGVVYGGLAVAQHTSFLTNALDLGTLDQAIWNTSTGRPLEYTPLPEAFGDATPDLSPGSRLVNGQLELILLPLSLLYWVWPDPRLLIALQAILLVTGAIPLYQLARTQLKDSIASLTISLAYLLYLPLHYVVLDGFHPAALMIPFLLWAWQAAEQEHWHNYYLAISIALLCQVDAALVLLGVGLYLFFVSFARSGSNQHRRHGAVTLLLSIAWLVLDVGLVLPWAKSIYGPGSRELLAGQQSGFRQDISSIVWGLLAHPWEAMRALLGREKLQSLVDLTAPLGWTPLLALPTLLPAVPALVLNLLAVSPSSFPNSIQAHNFAPAIPFLFLAAVRGTINAGRQIARFSNRGTGVWLSLEEGSRLATFFVFMMTLLAALFLSPLPPGLGFRLAHYYQIGEHEQALVHTLDLIPSDAVVSAQSNIFPHLSRRRTIYLFPTVVDAEFVVLDLDYSAHKAPLDEQTFYATVDGLLIDPAFHVAAFDRGVLLLQRGSGQPPPAFQEMLADYQTGLYRSALVEYRGPTQLRVNNMYQTLVSLENRGTQSWQSAGPYPIYLGYHWWSADGSLVEWDGIRTPLEQAIKQDEELTQPARFITPAESGDYILEWDLRHENSAWFGEQGGITLRVEVTVIE
jgi:uncharacterized membrane protein